LALGLRMPLSSLLEVYGGLYSLLGSEFEVKEVTQEHDALQWLQRPSDYVAVLITDGAIASADGKRIPHKQVCLKLQQYLEQGGTIICCGYMPSDLTTQAHEVFPKVFGVPWHRGEYIRSTFQLNPGTCLGSVGLPAMYSMKASHLGGVNPQDQALYTATNDSRVESFVFAPTPIDRSKNEFPAAFTKVFSGGHVGYVGDMNSEHPSSQVVLAMCRFARTKANAATALAPGVAVAACNGQEGKTGQGGDQPHVCLRCGQSRPKMRLCGGCRKVRLCSEECQRASWPQHKLVCGKQDS